MEIGILTLPFNANYGGILPAYALQTVLEQMGHHASHINRLPHHYLPPLLRPVAYAKRLVERYLLGRRKRIRFEAYHNAIVQHTNPFIAQHIHLVGQEGVSSLQAKDFDAIVVGSDQVWRPEFWSDITTPYLQFAREWSIRRIAYAASFGLGTWQYTEAQTRQCAELLACFDQVSVREEAAITLCRQHLGCEAVLMPDPTLLLHREDYLQLLPEASRLLSQDATTSTLFAYLLGDSEGDRALIDKLAQERGLRTHAIIADDSPGRPLSACVRPPLEEWIGGIASSSVVVTNSFHGCVLACIFGKPFIALAHQQGGVSRILSLLHSLGLEENPTTLSSSTIYDAGQPAVQQRIELLRQQGLDFLSRIQ